MKRQKDRKKKEPPPKGPPTREELIKEEHIKKQTQLRESSCSLSRNRKHRLVPDRHETGKCKFCLLPFCRCNACRKEAALRA
ncbi:MAG: hypothetical protein COB53_02385 [Elusimicrobia bacterium]|nr:MAG: hypothetical protein COB53_02385 [Elusimicrobiota bacterium]